MISTYITPGNSSACYILTENGLQYAYIIFHSADDFMEVMADVIINTPRSVAANLIEISNRHGFELPAPSNTPTAPNHDPL